MQPNAKKCGPYLRGYLGGLDGYTKFPIYCVIIKFTTNSFSISTLLVASAALQQQLSSTQHKENICANTRKINMRFKTGNWETNHHIHPSLRTPPNLTVFHYFLVIQF
jgi:hypothetical protein